MSQPDNTPRATSTSIDDGSDDHVTGSNAGTVRDELDHTGRRRPAVDHDDAGVTADAADEVAADDEDEPTRSE